MLVPSYFKLGMILSRTSCFELILQFSGITKVNQGELNYIVLLMM